MLSKAWNRKRGIGIRAACLLLCAAFVAAATMTHCKPDAYATPNEASGTDLSLTIYYEHDGRFVPDADVLIYRVAEVAKDGSLVPVEGLAHYPINWDVSDSSSAKDLAATLEGYILLSANSQSTYSSYSRAGYSPGGAEDAPLILPVDAGTTNANGVATFPSESAQLDEGYYLVMASSSSDGATFVQASPVLLEMPYTDDSGETIYDPKVQLKTRGFSLSRPSTLTIDASKVWSAIEGEGAEDQELAARPELVELVLLCDGAIYDSAVLNEENGWHYAWEGLSSSCTWKVVESSVPDGYRVSVSEDGTFVVVTNIFTDADREEPGTPPDGSEKPKPEEKPAKPAADKIIQTGQLWWPVPLLLALGVVFLGVGIAGRRHHG